MFREDLTSFDCDIELIIELLCHSCDKNITTPHIDRPQIYIRGPLNRHQQKCYIPSVHDCAEVGLGSNFKMDRGETSHQRWFIGNYRNIHFSSLLY